MAKKDDSEAKRLAGAKGGRARAERLPPEVRSEIGRAGALAKWSKEGVQARATPTALYGSPEKPMRIGQIEIPAYVLADGRRVLAQRGLQMGIGLSRSGGPGGARRLAALMDSLERKGIDTRGLTARVNSPILFTLPWGGTVAHGYEASILPDVCAVLIEAGQKGVLLKQQRHLAEQCAILQHGFATVGIIALVDEATGYQEVRRQNALAEILEKFVSKELRKWVRRFPFEYYEEIFRLKRWDTSDLTPGSPKPLEVGKITSNLIYGRLAPGVREELKRRTPRGRKGYLSNKLFQHLTEDIGDPKLEKHISVVIAIMKVSPDWPTFMANINKVLPSFGSNYELPLDDSSVPRIAGGTM